MPRCGNACIVKLDAFPVVGVLADLLPTASGQTSRADRYSRTFNLAPRQPVHHHAVHHVAHTPLCPSAGSTHHEMQPPEHYVHHTVHHTSRGILTSTMADSRQRDQLHFE